MTLPYLSDEEFLSTFARHGAEATAALARSTVRNVYARRARLEKNMGINALPPSAQGVPHGRVGIEDFRDGYVLVGSDAHYLPGIAPTTAHRAFVEFAKEYKPKIVIMNGDVIDASSISRHPPLGWETAPSVAEEIAESQVRLAEIVKASPKARHIWPLGNHDARFETRLATVAPEYAGVQGIHLKDHFPDWEPCWSVDIGQAPGGCMVKHRYKGGMHATHSNTLYSGRTIVTGDLHSLKVTPFSDYNGTRWGVDTGTLAHFPGKQFAYGEDNPVNWRSGFVLLRFQNGELLWPEIISVPREGVVDFRGSLLSI